MTATESNLPIDELLASLESAYRCALGICHDPVLAEEAVQDSVVKVLQTRNGFKGQSRFATWFKRIVINTAIDIMRREHGRGGHVVSLELLASELAAAGSSASGQEAREVIRPLIEQLPAGQRQALHMRFCAGYSYEAMEQQLSVRAGTLRMRVKRALASMRRSLLRTGGLLACLGMQRRVYAAGDSRWSRVLTACVPRAWPVLIFVFVLVAGLWPGSTDALPRVNKIFVDQGRDKNDGRQVLDAAVRNKTSTLKADDDFEAATASLACRKQGLLVSPCGTMEFALLAPSTTAHHIGNASRERISRPADQGEVPGGQSCGFRVNLPVLALQWTATTGNDVYERFDFLAPVPSELPNTWYHLAGVDPARQHHYACVYAARSGRQCTALLVNLATVSEVAQHGSDHDADWSFAAAFRYPASPAHGSAGRRMTLDQLQSQHQTVVGDLAAVHAKLVKHSSLMTNN